MKPAEEEKSAHDGDKAIDHQELLPVALQELAAFLPRPPGRRTDSPGPGAVDP